MSSKKTNIYLLRHGLPEGDNCLRGITDFAITELGLEQMEVAVANLQFDAVISSPLSRCAYFAKQLATKQMANFIENPDLAEMNFGDWDGQLLSELFEESNTNIMLFFECPYEVTPPNGETMTHFNQRVTKVFNSLCKQYLGKQVLLVTHAGVMREIVQFVLGIPPHLSCHQSLHLDYASLIKISVIEDKDQLYFRLHL
ncbi:histidine phosphatase family protein [Pseudoalteromonas sp. SSM20]|uniref:histidine phosphatase family protein n=1 Tax=Pseudoalteromonas sp. SSM20 TaxID=3139394 RepID=UPI003BAA5C90